MKCIKILVIALLGISISGCSMRENQGDINENSIIWEADLTHDGEKELIFIEVDEIKKDSQKPMKISVRKNQKELWSDELYLPGDGNKEYFLLNEKDGDYLLYYYPENSQGMAYYEYKKFYIEDEKEQIVDSKCVEFPTYQLAEGETLPLDNMIDLWESINENLQKGYLLGSTMEGKLMYSTENEKITKTEEFNAVFESDVNFKYDKQENDMKEKLLALEKYLQKK